MTRLAVARDYPATLIRGRIGLPSTLQLLLLLLLMFLILYPVGMVFYGGFRSGSPYGQTYWTLQGWSSIFADATFPRLLANTLGLAVARTVGIMVFACTLAYLVYRTDVPGRSVFEKLIMFRFFIPPIPIILAWILIFSPASGFVNVLLKPFLTALGVQKPIFDVFSYSGIIWVGTLGLSTLVFVMVGPAFRNMDASLEEASRMSGASNRATLWKITLPMLQPAILSMTVLIFVRMLSSFESELFLGSKVGIYVLTTKIYRSVAMEPPSYPPAMAMANILLIVTILLVFVQWRILGSREFTTVSGRGFRVRPMALGRWRWVGFGFLVLVVLVNIVAPLAALIVGSFMKISGVFMANMWTIAHWQRIFNEPRVFGAVKNTVLVAGVAATVGMVLSSLVAYIVIRTRFSGRKAMDLVVWFPFVTPHLVLALGFLWAYTLLPMPFPMYGTIFLMMLAFITCGLPVGTRTMANGMFQISKELEESSRVHGASWTRTFLRIWMPLVRSAFLGGWMILFSTTMWDLNINALLYGPKSEVLSTLLFDYWNGGFLEPAVILGFLEAGLTAAVFLITRLLGGRGFGSM